MVASLGESPLPDRGPVTPLKLAGWTLLLIWRDVLPALRRAACLADTCRRRSCWCGLCWGGFCRRRFRRRRFCCWLSFCCCRGCTVLLARPHLALLLLPLLLLLLVIILLLALLLLV